MVMGSDISAGETVTSGAEDVSFWMEAVDSTGGRSVSSLWRKTAAMAVPMASILANPGEADAAFAIGKGAAVPAWSL
ncbi:MAG TPA: hypothetical protein VFI87_03740, partial [Hyphomicrobiaceae bacterium]|nr:hypothetical protein [Hyphomicrobiaceae bacterium]